MVQNVQNNDMSVVENQALALVDLSATWCGPCQALKPIVHELADELEGQVAVFNVDVDENPDVARNYKVMSVPTLLVFKNGELVDRMVGLQSKDELKDWVLSR